MKMYALDNGDYPEDERILGLFTTLEKAMLYWSGHPEEFYSKDLTKLLTEYEVDPQ